MGVVWSVGWCGERGTSDVVSWCCWKEAVADRWVGA